MIAGVLIRIPYTSPYNCGLLTTQVGLSRLSDSQQLLMQHEPLKKAVLSDSPPLKRLFCENPEDLPNPGFCHKIDNIDVAKSCTSKP